MPMSGVTGATRSRRRKRQGSAPRLLRDGTEEGTRRKLGPFLFAPTRKNPRQSTHAWGSGEFVTARLLTRQQGASGDGGCCPVGQCAFDEDFLLGKQLHLGMRRSAAYLRAGIEPILRRSISPAEPLWCLIRALTMHTGRECRERPRETLLVALLSEPR